MIRNEPIDRDDLIRLLQPLLDHLGVTVDEVYRLNISPDEVELMVYEVDDEGRRLVSRCVDSSALYGVARLRITP